MPSQHAHSSSVEEKPVVPYILYAFTTCTQFVCKGFVKEKHVVCLTCCVPFTTCTQFVCKGGNGPPAHPNNAPFLPEIQTRNTHKMHSVNRDATRTICIQPIVTQHAQYAYSQSWRNTHNMHTANRATRTICIQSIVTQHAQYAYSQWWRNMHNMHTANDDATCTIYIQPIVTQHAQYAYSQLWRNMHNMHTANRATRCVCRPFSWHHTLFPRCRMCEADRSQGTLAWYTWYIYIYRHDRRQRKTKKNADWHETDVLRGTTVGGMMQTHYLWNKRTTWYYSWWYDTDALLMKQTYYVVLQLVVWYRRTTYETDVLRGITVGGACNPAQHNAPP